MYFLDEEPRKKARIEIIPMIDVMMFLLVFFVLISLNVIPSAGLATQLPNSRNAARQTPPTPPAIVTVTAKGELQLNGKTLAPTALPTALKALQRPGAQLAVILKSDGATQVQHMVEVMDLIRDGGISQISIAAKKKA